MVSTRPFGPILTLAMFLGAVSACSSALLLKAPVSKAGDGWTLTLTQVKAGPDEYIGEVVTLTPESGEKFIWALLTVKNDSPQEQTFSYEACTLDGKAQSRPPAVVDRHAERPAAADLSEAFDPGQERTRALIYRFPRDARPIRMKCGTVVLPIRDPG
jgi:hypothetical protein